MAALASNPALEALVRDHDDDASWQVLEDWLLETNDPRARLVRLEKAGEPTLATLGELRRTLLGENEHDIRADEWRAGYPRRATIVAALDRAGEGWSVVRKTPAEISATMNAIAALPALALLRDLRLELEANVYDVLEGLAELAPRIESLALEFHYSATIFTAECLAPFERLERLRVRAPLDQLTGLEKIPKLRALELEILPRGVADALRTNPLPELRSLSILTGTLLYPWHGVFDRLFDGACAPKLEELHLDAAPTSGNLDFLRDLAQSRLGARLRRLTLAGLPCELPMLHRLGRATATPPVR